MEQNLYIIIPAYNEAENIKQVIDEWYPVVERHNPDKSSYLVIVNDGSTDDTVKITEGIIKDKPFVKVLTKQNGGHGSAVLCGYRYAIKEKADYVFQTDSDGQTDPNEFEKFWDLKNEYNIILGDRIKRGDGKGRAFVEGVVCLLLRLYFGVKVPDANAPFRLMKTDILAKYIDRIPQDYELPNIILTMYFVYYNEKVRFEKISFKPRKNGKNTIDFEKIFKIGIKSLKDFSYFKKEIRDDKNYCTVKKI